MINDNHLIRLILSESAEGRIANFVLPYYDHHTHHFILTDITNVVIYQLQSRNVCFWVCLVTWDWNKIIFKKDICVLFSSTLCSPMKISSQVSDAQYWNFGTKSRLYDDIQHVIPSLVVLVLVQEIHIIQSVNVDQLSSIFYYLLSYSHQYQRLSTAIVAQDYCVFLFI